MLSSSKFRCGTAHVDIASARPGRGGGVAMMDSGFGMGWMWLFWLLLVLGVVLLVVVVARALGGGVTGPTTDRRDAGERPGRSRARRLLDERYARGEITTEEYRERLSELGEET
jgi:putative membrane protein